MGMQREQERKPIIRAKMFNVGKTVKVGLVKESKEPMPGYVEGTVHNPSTNEDVTKYFDIYARITGYVNACEWYRRKDEKSGTTFAGLRLAVADNDGMDIYIDLPFDTKPYRVFVHSARNVDFNQEVTFSAWKGTNQKSGKDEIAFAIFQNDKSVPWYWTKDSEGLPKAYHDEMTGKWDFREQQKFLLEDLLDSVKPDIELAAANRGIEAPKPYDPDDEWGQDEAPAPGVTTESLLNDIFGEYKRLGKSKEVFEDWCLDTEAEKQSIEWLQGKLDRLRSQVAQPADRPHQGKGIAAVAAANRAAKPATSVVNDSDIPF